MQVILELEEDREQKASNRFRVALWLHDGAYVKMRSPNARERDLAGRLEERCREMAEFAGKDMPIPAFFEIEKVTLPEFPGDPDAGAAGEDAGVNEPEDDSSPESDGRPEGRPPEASGSRASGPKSDPPSAQSTRTPLPGPSSEERVPIGQEPKTLREDEKTELSVLHVSKNGRFTIGPEPEHVAKLYPTSYGARQAYLQKSGVHWLRGGVRRDGEWATDSTLYEVKINGSYRFVEIHRHRGIRDVPLIEVGRRVFGRHGSR